VRWRDPRLAALAHVARGVTEAPSAFARPPTLTDDELLHAVALAAYFGHLNRIADAVGVPLDYPVAHEPPHAVPSVPALLPGRLPSGRTAKLSIASRPATAEKVADWDAYVFERDTPLLSRERRARIARRVELLLGNRVEELAPVDELDADLRALADRITLAPWQLDAATYAPLRARGFDDAALFDACVVASTAGVGGRIAVALAAIAED
jgi:alkylhydroperoxidase family enzyme